MRKKASKAKAYRLNFGGTKAKKYASTKKQALRDAYYWRDFGQVKVCIDRKMPSGVYKQIKCIKRKKR